MIEAGGFAPKGIGLTEAHLIASCLPTPGTILVGTRFAGQMAPARLSVPSGVDPSEKED